MKTAIEIAEVRRLAHEKERQLIVRRRETACAMDVLAAELDTPMNGQSIQAHQIRQWANTLRAMAYDQEQLVAIISGYAVSHETTCDD
jgi:hypothetical protein